MKVEDIQSARDRIPTPMEFDQLVRFPHGGRHLSRARRGEIYPRRPNSAAPSIADEEAPIDVSASAGTSVGDKGLYLLSGSGQILGSTLNLATGNVATICSA